MKKPSKRPLAAISGALLSLSLAACTGDVHSPGTAEPGLTSHPAELVEHSAQARAVFVGEVVSIEHRLSQPDAGGRAVPFHFVTWRVERAVRGVEAGSTWTGRFAGGSFGDGRTLWVSEVPEFEVGQRALVLANDGDAGSCALAGCRDGLLVIGDARGTRLEPAALERVIASLDPDGPAAGIRARSADPRAPFAFTMPAAERLPPMARARARPAVKRTDDPERRAFEQNGRNPVIR